MDNHRLSPGVNAAMTIAGIVMDNTRYHHSYDVGAVTSLIAGSNTKFAIMLSLAEILW